MLAECIQLLQPAPNKLFVDGTLGGGGHTAALLEKGSKVIGIDQDGGDHEFNHDEVDTILIF